MSVTGRRVKIAHRLVVELKLGGAIKVKGVLKVKGLSLKVGRLILMFVVSLLLYITRPFLHYLASFAH